MERVTISASDGELRFRTSKGSGSGSHKAPVSSKEIRDHRVHITAKEQEEAIEEFLRRKLEEAEVRDGRARRRQRSVVVHNGRTGSKDEHEQGQGQGQGHGGSRAKGEVHIEPAFYHEPERDADGNVVALAVAPSSSSPRTASAGGRGRKSYGAHMYAEDFSGCGSQSPRSPSDRLARCSVQGPLAEWRGLTDPNITHIEPMAHGHNSLLLHQLIQLEKKKIGDEA